MSTDDEKPQTRQDALREQAAEAGLDPDTMLDEREDAGPKPPTIYDPLCDDA